MHKIFAKPLFLGKKVVFLPECHSTNDELASMTKKKSEPEGLVVYTDNQIRGKGQRGNAWIAEPGKNILMSVLLKPKKLVIQNQFYLNLIAGLAVIETLDQCTQKKKELKWPNDIYLNGKKVCGILIESNLRGNTLESSIIGIGLNLNQMGFSLPTATSIAMETQNQFDREEIMEEVIRRLEGWYLKLNNYSFQEILDQYHKKLMWRGELHEFSSNGELFKGVIQGVDDAGRLMIRNTLGNMMKFNIKEIEFMR